MRERMIKKIVIMILTIMLFCSIVFAKDDSNFYNVEYVRNYDGDTITVNIKNVHPLIGDEINIRVRGIDTPEIRGKCQYEKDLAYEAKYFVRDILLFAKKIDLMNVERGKYFRIVSDVYIDGKDIKDFLLDTGYIVMYNGGSKVNWCK